MAEDRTRWEYAWLWFSGASGRSDQLERMIGSSLLIGSISPVRPDEDRSRECLKPEDSSNRPGIVSHLDGGAVLACSGY